jgi:hypothetical protein
MRRNALLLSIAMSTNLAFPATAQVVSFTGAGPVELGMTIAAAERSMGAKFAPISLPFSEDCWITSRADGKDKGIDYIVQDGTIVRIDFEPRDGEQINLKTAAGIGIGSTEDDIRRAYKEVIVARAPYFSEESEVEAAKYRAERGITAPEPPPQYQVRVDSPNRERGIIFVTQDSKVISFFTGFKAAIEEMEICR